MSSPAQASFGSRATATPETPDFPQGKLSLGRDTQVCELEKVLVVRKAKFEIPWAVQLQRECNPQSMGANPRAK